MKFIDEKVEFYAKTLVNMFSCPLNVYNSNFDLIFSYGDIKAQNDWLKNDAELLKAICTHSITERIFLYNVSGSIVFGGIWINAYLLVCGPLNVGNVLGAETLNLYASMHKSEPYTISTCNLKTFVHALFLIYSSVYQDLSLSYTDLLKRSFIKHDLFKHLESTAIQIVTTQIENSAPHRPFSAEKKMFDAISNGLVEQIKPLQNHASIGNYGTLAKDSLRSEKNISIVDITLATRAAIVGGMDAEEAYILADSLILTLEEAESVQDAFLIKIEAQSRFAQIVKELKEKIKNLTPSTNDSQGKLTPSQIKLVNTAKSYIKRNINNKFSVLDLCEKLDISKTYLYNIFKASEQCNINEYVLKQKVRVAKYLLQFSNYSLSEISSSLAFSSQSHFTSVFKKLEGTTPAQYRNNQNSSVLLKSEDPVMKYFQVNKNDKKDSNNS